MRAAMCTPKPAMSPSDRNLDVPHVDPRTDWQARAYSGPVSAINRQKLREEVARILD